MTDNEIKEAKSLMWLANQFPKIENPEGANDKLWNCINLYCTNAADLINRQKAEIERLQNALMGECMLSNCTRENEIKSEAYRELGEKLKAKLGVKKFTVIDDLVEEMTEQKGCENAD